MSMDAAPTITEFLLARIAEDEAMAKAAAADKNDRRMDISFPDPAGNSWTADQGMVSGEGKWNTLWDCEGAESLCTAPAIAEHMARHDPARILAECTAKRAIMDAHPIVDDVVEVSTRIKWGFACETCFSYGDVVEDNGYCDTLRALAAVYADHPDYRQEWAA